MDLGGNAGERKGEERREGRIEEVSRMLASAALLSIVFSIFTNDSYFESLFFVRMNQTATLLGSSQKEGQRLGTLLG